MRKLFSIVLGIAFAATATAVPAYRGPILRTMEDGTQKTVFLHGNEHFHYMTDAEGRWLDEKRLTPMTEEQQTIRQEGLQASRVRRAPQQEQGAGDAPYLVPRVLLLLVNFADTKFSTPKDTIDSLLNGAHFSRSYTTLMSGTSGWSDYMRISASGSARQYFQEQSYGQYNPVFDVVGPVNLTKNASYYGQNDSWGNENHAYEMIKDACAKANEAGLDFRQYDQNNDGTIDLVYVIYAGHGEADGGADSTVWPHQSDLSGYNYRHDGKYIGHYACGCELSYSSKQYAGIGTLCHEFSHVLGLPDLYETNTNQTGLHTLCNWDIMDYGSYNNDGNTPPAYSAYERFYMGWLTPRVLTEPEYVTLHPLSEGEALLISTTDKHNLSGWNPSPTAFYLLENRKKEGWDQYVPGNGMLITKITYRASLWRTNRVNISTRTMGVDILEAKENTSTSGKSSDAFPAGAVKQWTDVEDHEITSITRSATDGIIRFSYRGADLPEGVEEVQTDKAQRTKVLRNGQLYILYKGQMYDIQGRRVKE